MEYESRGRFIAGGGKVAVEASICEEAEESSFKLFRQPAHHMRLSIVEIAVLPDQVHLGLERKRICVVIVKQALPYSSKVGWLSHHIVVIRNV